MVAQSDEAEGQGAASGTFGIAVPVKVVVVDDRPVECWTIAGRYDDDGRRFDQCSRCDGLPCEDPTAARGAGTDLDAMIRCRSQAGERRRAGQPTSRVQTCSRGRSAPAGAAVLAAAPGGGTCACAGVSASSSSFIPALKALMPLAKSPITRGSFPAPKRIRIMAKTTIQCIKLNEPIAATPED